MSNRRIPAKQANKYAVIDNVNRTQTILSCFINSVGDDRAADRYVLWTVEEIIGDLPSAIDWLPTGKEVSHGQA